MVTWIDNPDAKAETAFLMTVPVGRVFYGDKKGARYFVGLSLHGNGSPFTKPAGSRELARYQVEKHIGAWIIAAGLQPKETGVAA